MFSTELFTSTATCASASMESSVKIERHAFGLPSAPRIA